MHIEPYLFFDGRASPNRFSTSTSAPPEPGMVPPGFEDKVMHAHAAAHRRRYRVASDGRCQGAPKFEGFSLSITAPDDAAAGALFTALGDGGAVRMPMTRTFFSSLFGMVADRFGVVWLIHTA